MNVSPHVVARRAQPVRLNDVPPKQSRGNAYKLTHDVISMGLLRRNGIRYLLDPAPRNDEKWLLVEYPIQPVECGDAVGFPPSSGS